jgi:uncharacterized protein DUF4325
MVIRILDIVTGADTSEQGAAVLGRLQSALSVNQIVTVSFRGINTATSSFVSTGLVPLLQDIKLNDLKRRLQIVDSTRQINDMIKTRLNREGSIAA